MTTVLPKIYTFDIETFPNCFLFTGKFLGDSNIHVFEISSRKNMRSELVQWLNYLKAEDALMNGFNNLGFDYPIVHELINSPYTFDAIKAYQLCQQIISSGDHNLNHAIRYENRHVKQLDIWKMNHFDNANRRTSLKSLQFAMRSDSVEDLPFEVGKILTSEEIDTLIKYNIHDVTETEKFLEICLPAIQMRLDLIESGVVKGDVLNYNDVKIGEQYLVNKIGRQKCYSGPKPRQTFRSEIHFKNIILPKIQFRSETCNNILDWFKTIVVYPTRKGGENPKLSTKFGGIDFVFGLGGVHASVESKVFKSDKDYVIKDVDVSGMYPAVAIANGFYPEHLGQDFLIHYKQLQIDRKQHKKGTTMNAVLKLAGNGVYGKSNDIYSCFYDPQYTFSVTVNGQLQALQLAERFISIPKLQIIQANTDGITALVPREHLWMFEFHKSDWQKETGLALEEVEYQKMWVRDVNNYVALKNDGTTKLKGAYWYPKTLADYEGYWNKDYSMMVVQKCAEAMLVHDMNPEAIIGVFTNPFDFMKRYKSNAASKVYIGSQLCPKTVRYYVSTQGEPMVKIDPPRGEEGSFKRKNGLTDKEFNDVLNSIPKGQWDERIHTGNKSVYKQVSTGIEAGKKVKICNKASDFNFNDVDWDYYIEEVKKLYIKE